MFQVNVTIPYLEPDFVKTPSLPTTCVFGLVSVMGQLWIMDH